MPSARAEDFRRVAARLGFECQRQTGSHERWTHADGRGVTIPIHGGAKSVRLCSTESSSNSGSALTSFER